MKWFLLGCILFIGSSGHCLQHRHAISYDLLGGRFGDKVLGFSAAYYWSWVTGIPLLYRPFLYSDQLVVAGAHNSYEQYASNYSSQFHIHSEATLTEFLRQIRDPNTPPTLFIINFLPIDISEWDRNNSFALLFNIPWDDVTFIESLRKSLQPCITIPDFTKSDKLNVAIHVRTLCGDDTVTSLIGFPLKHPTSDYHKRQIKKIYAWNLKRPMHVFIFSDTNQPADLVSNFRRSFKGDDITFDIQTLIRPDLHNTVQDFFAMQKFDVLIATQSTFSAMAAYLGSFDIIIFPMHVQGTYPHYKIDRVKIISKKSVWFPYDFNIIVKD